MNVIAYGISAAIILSSALCALLGHWYLQVSDLYAVDFGRHLPAFPELDLDRIPPNNRRDKK